MIQVVGSRDDVQPFVVIGTELKKYGHRVRLATHLVFRQFVLDACLEFFNIGGNPKEPMALMVQNSDLFPTIDSMRSGIIQRNRMEMRQIIDGCWHSCFEKGDGTTLHQIREELWTGNKNYRDRPFVADAIIANPPSLAHMHCARRLGVPLHMMFTLVHPLSFTLSQVCYMRLYLVSGHIVLSLFELTCLGRLLNISRTHYPLLTRRARSLLRQILRLISSWTLLFGKDLANKFRKICLALDPLSTTTVTSLIHRLKIPFAYLCYDSGYFTSTDNKC